MLLRESADFDSLDTYRRWLDHLIRHFNKRCAAPLSVERAALQDLPEHRTTDYSEEVVKVTNHSTTEVKRVLYTVQGESATASNNGWITGHCAPNQAFFHP